MRFGFMRANKSQFQLKIMARVFGVSMAAYHAWLHRGQSQRGKQDQQLQNQILQYFMASRKTYGAPRIKKNFEVDGQRVSRARIRRLMKAQHLRPIQKRKFKVTTNSKHHHVVAKNVMNRNFNASKPNQKWVTDITFLRTTDGWLYLAVVIDLFSRRVVGWSIQSTLGTSLVINALEMARGTRKGSAGVLHHSDRGVQYASQEYAQALSCLKAVQSMSRKGDCWDNAVCESFFSTLKTELSLGKPIGGHGFTRGVVFEWIEVFYNRQRRHSSLGFVSPCEFERRYFAEQSV